MLNTVTITNDVGDSIVLDMFDPWSSGIAIRNIDGLGPVNADIKTTDYASKDGASYNGSRQGTRNIVFDLVFLDSNVSIEKVRHLTYRYFPNKRKIHMKFVTDTRTLETDGYVESNEPSIWAEDYESCQISVICESPYFRATNEMTYKLSDVIDSFHFPFASTEEPELTFGYLNVERSVIVKNNGDAATGMIFELHAYGTVTNPIIYNYVTGEWFGLIFVMREGDLIRINTETGKKTVTLIREGVTLNIINTIRAEYNNTSLTWLQNGVGETAFVLDFEEYGTTPDMLDLIIRHTDCYLGI